MAITNLGDYPTGKTLIFPFHTFESTNPAASVTITDFVTGDIAIYKDGGIAQRTSAVGVTFLDDGIDFDGITGVHAVSINTSDDTDPGFYAGGSDYWVRIGPVTCDGATINFWAAIFSIDNRGLLRPTTAQRTLNVSGGGAGVNWADVNNQSAAIALTNTDISRVSGSVGKVLGNVSGSVQMVTGAVASVTGDVGGNVVGNVGGTVASVSGSVADVLAISGSTDAADKFEASALTIVTGTASGTLSTTTMDTNLTEGTNDHYNGRQIVFTSGVLQDQATSISDYSGSSKTVVMVALTEAPGSGDGFNIV